MVLSGELAVVTNQRARDGRPGQPVKIHGKEGDVGEDITDPEPFVERQAVKNSRAVVHAEDVVCEEVAVAIANKPCIDPIGEQLSGGRSCIARRAPRFWTR